MDANIKKVSLQSCHIFKQSKLAVLFLDFFRSDKSKMDHTSSNLIKMNFLIDLKMLLSKVATFMERIKMAVLFWIFLDQICPKWIKLDQIGFPHQYKNVTIKSCHIYRKDKNDCFVFLISLDQT